MGHIVSPSDGEKPTLAQPERCYVSKQGDALFYDVGVVHSDDRQGLTKLARIASTNFDYIKRSNIKAV